jgi:hypothetical protein
VCAEKLCVLKFRPLKNRPLKKSRDATLWKISCGQNCSAAKFPSHVARRTRLDCEPGRVTPPLSSLTGCGVLCPAKTARIRIPLALRNCGLCLCVPRLLPLIRPRSSVSASLPFGPASASVSPALSLSALCAPCVFCACLGLWPHVPWPFAFLAHPACGLGSRALPSAFLFCLACGLGLVACVLFSDAATLRVYTCVNIILLLMPCSVKTLSRRLRFWSLGFLPSSRLVLSRLGFLSRAFPSRGLAGCVASLRLPATGCASPPRPRLPLRCFAPAPCGCWRSYADLRRAGSRFDPLLRASPRTSSASFLRRSGILLQLAASLSTGPVPLPRRFVVAVRLAAASWQWAPW